MTRPVDPYVVRKLADCIELLPRYINNPQKMPFVQEVVQRAFEQNRFDRKASVLGAELLGKPRQAEKYRKPVTSVWLSDSDKDALKDGFEEDETGIFESFEHLAAEIGEWLKECRRPRDAELFRSRLSFVCGEALLHSRGVEVSPNLYRLDLSSWEAEVAKPLCDDLRELADDIEAEDMQRDSSGGQATGNPAQGDSPASSPWHAAGEEPPVGWYGPLPGTKAELFTKIMHRQVENPQQELDRELTRNKNLWGRKNRRTDFEVHFKSEKKWDNARQ